MHTKVPRPIRSLNRGLDVLIQLNRLERAAINTLAGAVRLPRTTTYRILETLRCAGYVDRDPHDDCYRPTIRVRALSDGFGDAAMVAHIAKPHLTALGVEIVWPVAVATPAGAAMMVRETTDRESPLALEQHGAGPRQRPHTGHRHGSLRRHGGAAAHGGGTIPAENAPGRAENRN
jgi:IclR family transcriptional regulator, mhp operon transcriptional activator